MVDSDCFLSEIAEEVCKIKDVNIEYKSRYVKLVMFAISKGEVRGIFNMESRLTQYYLTNNEITCIEILTSEGR